MKSTLLFTLLVFIGTSFGQLSPMAVSIPMTDANTLAADVYLPNATDQFPVVLIMTPYNKAFYTTLGLPLGVGTDITSSNYAFVVVDNRCRFASLSACAAGSDDGDDGYDVVEWIASQTWSNGKIGMWGPSALGNIQFKTAAKQPPSLHCIVPEVAGPHQSFEHYFRGGSLTVETLETLEILFPGVLAPIVGNPHHNLTWGLVEAGTSYSADIEVPTLVVGGWFDKNVDQTIYVSEELHDLSPASAQIKTIVGPWVHGGTGAANVGSAIQGELNFPEAEDWNEIYALQFYDYHLRGISNGWPSTPDYTYFQMGENIWNGSDVWPSTDVMDTIFYMHDDGSLTETAPVSAVNTLSFTYDPTDPSPTHGGKTLNTAMVQGPFDQVDSVEVRADNLIFTTAAFTEDVRLQGKIKINLFVSSDRLDTDFCVRITEVYPDDKSILLEDDILRMRFRDGFAVADTSFMTAGTVYPITITTDDLANTFLAGNKLRLIITSSNYPRYNRNMNTGGEMYPDNNIDSLEAPLVATNTVELNSTYPSNIVLPIGENNPLGIEDEIVEAGIKIYPNPSSFGTTVLYPAESAVVTLRDISGKLISTELSEGGMHYQSLDKLKAGTYFVTINTNEGNTYQEKLVVGR